MKRIIARGCCAALLLSVGATANAVPISFEFTGTITEYLHDTVAGSEIGMAVSGGFRFDTDRLFRNEFQEPGQPLTVAFDAEQGSASSFITFGDRHLEFPLLPSDFGTIQFRDACPGTGCLSENTADIFALYMFSSDFTQGAVPHPYTNMAIGALGRQTEAPFEFFDYFDATNIDATAVVTLPFLVGQGFFEEGTNVCENGLCLPTTSSAFLFRVDSVTRRIEASAVPEPGTFGLFGAAFAGMLLMRRRRRVAG